MRLVHVVSLLLAALLAGCAHAPGMALGDGWQDTAAVRGEGAGAAAPSDARPARPHMTSITPDLLARQRTERGAAIPDPVLRLFAKPQPYRVGPGDILGITFWSHPELAFPASAPLTQLDATGQTVPANGFAVSHDGFIQFPFAGAIEVAGLTEGQIRQRLLQEISVYLKDPQLTVRVVAYRSGRVYVGGEVRTPGLQALNDVPLTLPDAVGRAGGFTALANRSAVTVTRDGVSTTIDLRQLDELGIDPAGILLAPGDLVRVANREESRVYVLGEVTRPMPLVMRDGRMTLGEALGESGGVSQVSADPRQIYVLRNGVHGRSHIYRLDARSPQSLALAGEFALQPRDIVFVDPAPLVRWNRVISLLLPSAGLLDTTSEIGQ